jgi:catechol 2,3-dioxygenase-like lactoylglutathione lyase family enzyme/uncharacterized protein YndB with AHSA1/START domain
MTQPIPLNQVAFAVLDLRRTEAWWREGLGFLPAGGSRNLFRPPLSDGLVQKLPGSAMTCWCMLGRNDWAQLEMFQYEAPVSALMPEDYQPCDLGYSRCGVWVEDFDAALQSLAALGSQPLAPVQGRPGKRRACVRNPDGVYVELMEDDPLPQQNLRGRLDCPVALRSVTLSTPDLAKSAAFLVDGLGMRESEIVLHRAPHEALWGLAGARCSRKVFIGGNARESILLELVQYRSPRGQPLPADYRLCDQRILNACFGDPHSSAGVLAMRETALAAGARENSKLLDMKLVGCTYLEDPLGFSWELMWAATPLHKAFGFVPTGVDQRPQLDNQRIDASVLVEADAQMIFALLADHAGLSDWAGLGRVRLLRQGDSEPAGRGAVRVVSSPLGDVHEQITDWWPGRGYRYRIIQGSPFVGYWGEVSLTPEAAGTRVDWSMRFRSRIPLAGGLLARVLQVKLKQALQSLKQRAERGA